MRVPGVYLWRGGWIGRPEYPDYQGRGATSVEYYQDGLPLIPLGRDSVAFDPSLTALSLYERIEIERWPGLLRVNLFTWRNPRRSARSRVGLSSGDKNISRYLGSLERRFNGGIGLALAGEYLDAPSGSGFSSGHTNTHYWLQLSYVPSENFGVTAQTVRMSPKRDAFLRALNDTIGDFLVGDRKDDELRVFYKRGKGDLGLRADLLYGHSAWRGSGVNQVVDQVGAVVSLRGPSIQLGGSAFHRSPLDHVGFQGHGGMDRHSRRHRERRGRSCNSMKAAAPAAGSPPARVSPCRSASFSRGRPGWDRWLPPPRSIPSRPRISSTSPAGSAGSGPRSASRSA
jgi:hypothetical protein